MAGIKFACLKWVCLFILCGLQDTSLHCHMMDTPFSGKYLKYYNFWCKSDLKKTVQKESNQVSRLPVRLA